MNHIKASFPAGRSAPALRLPAVNRDHLWDIFRKLSAARKHYRLSSGAVHTLGAMLSFLRDGGQPIVFASNQSILKRALLDNDRTLRRHIADLVKAGFLARQDSTNCKRYRSTDPVTGEVLAFGFNLSLLLQRSQEVVAVAEEIEAEERRCKHLRTVLLTRLAHLQDNHPELVGKIRKVLRRKMTVEDYLAAIKASETALPSAKTPPVPAFAENAPIGRPTISDKPTTTERSATGGQNVRHQSISKKEYLDLTSAVEKMDDHRLIQLVVETCSESVAFATVPVVTSQDLERLARQLAPMMGIDRSCYEQACAEQPRERVALSTLLILQMGTRIRCAAAYFRAVMVGKRARSFDPMALLMRLSRAIAAPPVA